MINNQIDFLKNLDFSFQPKAVVDILLVALIIYYGYTLIRQTRAMTILWGILFLGIITLLARLWQLETFNYIIRYFITMILVAIPVVFQPELRQALEKLGRARLIGDYGFWPEKQVASIVSKIVTAAEILSKKKWGALIVIARSVGLKEYIDTGVKLHGRLSAELIVNIFTPGAPLHDRAIVIIGDEIAAAAVTLPLSEDLLLNYHLGTRHRAGLGLSEVTDAAVIIVSEETGKIALAVDGELQRGIDFDTLELKLIELLSSGKFKNKF